MSQPVSAATGAADERHMDIVAVALKHTRVNSIAIISPSVKNHGQWQLTRVDEYGPFSDSQCASYAAAAELARRESFKVPVSDAELNAFIVNGKELKRMEAGA